jgi:transcriptional regulator with XRE-family HTH domain
MDDISERIKELIDNSGLSHKEFAEKIDVSPAIISHILSGRNKPSLQVIQRITNVYTNVNLNYLLSGAGELYRRKPDLGTPKVETRGKPLAMGFSEGVRPVAAPRSTPLARRVDTEPLPSLPNTINPVEKEEAKQAKETNVNNKDDGNSQLLNKKKTIERVIIFYSDKTMEEYKP